MGLMFGNATYSFNGFSFLFRHADLLCPRWEGYISSRVFTQQLQELTWILPDQLSQLRVASADLLQNGLQHTRLGLHDLSKLLELWIVAKKVQVAKPSTCCSSSTFSARGGGSTKAGTKCPKIGGTGSSP